MQNSIFLFSLITVLTFSFQHVISYHDTTPSSDTIFHLCLGILCIQNHVPFNCFNNFLKHINYKSTFKVHCQLHLLCIMTITMRLSSIIIHIWHLIKKPTAVNLSRPTRYITKTTFSWSLRHLCKRPLKLTFTNS